MIFQGLWCVHTGVLQNNYLCSINSLPQFISLKSCLEQMIWGVCFWRVEEGFPLELRRCSPLPLSGFTNSLCLPLLALSDNVYQEQPVYQIHRQVTAIQSSHKPGPRFGRSRSAVKKWMRKLSQQARTVSVSRSNQTLFKPPPAGGNSRSQACTFLSS